MPGEKNSISVVAFQLLYMTVEALLLGSPPYYTNTVKNLAKIISLENMYCKCGFDDAFNDACDIGPFFVVIICLCFG